ncbi:hypothetical protein MPSEU_000971000 [Mayamaea pseudoterrestris]|nr:hypothetical protein MPSEU_000971000 [Mayamaea pseudoterrestris]
MDISDLPPPLPGRERHVLQAEEELRFEVAFGKGSTCTIILQAGSCELFGVELASNKEYVFVDGGLKLALFTWYGCVLDIECDAQHLEICYVSEASETIGNIALVNTHAQLEALRDEAAVSGNLGPRILVVGPPESGKSTCVKVLLAYACKLGRTPLLVDLDPSDSSVSVPGTLTVCPYTRDTVSVDSYATTGVPAGAASPLVLWHGSTQPSADLFKAQVKALGNKIRNRLESDDWERSSGILVDTNGWLQDAEGYPVLLETIQALRISVVLIMGHDRLYSMLHTYTEQEMNSGDEQGKKVDKLKVIKLPRSGGIVSRNPVFMRQWRSRAMKRYFYGGMVDAPQSQQKESSTKLARVPQLTPFLMHVSFSQVKIFKYTSMSLSASLLPVAAAQTTEPVQLAPVTVSEQLQLTMLAVCHPQAVAAYEASGKASDLYESGVAGFCVVEKVLMDSDMLHLLSPCAGVLPSNVLLMGDVIWMD